jgi:lipid-A-disaccharide synthase
MSIFIIAGEVSGDLYAAHLAKALKREQPKLVIFGIGGDHLQAQSDEFVFQSAYNHDIGIHDIFSRKQFKLNLLNSLKETLSKATIKEAVIVDFQHLNANIAALLKSYSIRVYTVITPNFWMWKDRRSAQKICDYSEKIICIFKKEYEFYQSLTNNAFYFGHPMTELVQEQVQQNTVSKQVTLLPGSRPQEFHLYFKIMLTVAQKLQSENADLSIKIAVASRHYEAIVTSYLGQFPQFLECVSYDNAQEEIAKSHLVISATGSATLEVILLKKPLIVLAALPILSFLYARYILGVKTKNLSLPNFLTNQAIVPEFVQTDMKVSTIFQAAKYWLNNPDTSHYEAVIAEITKEKQVFTAMAKNILGDKNTL